MRLEEFLRKKEEIEYLKKAREIELERQGKAMKDALALE